MAKITKRLVDATAGRAGTVLVWDSELKGFGLRVSPGGAKTYFVKYRAWSGRGAPQRWLTIGRHGSPWTAAQARAKALAILGAVARGEDPAEAQKVEARTMTLEALAALYLSEGCGHKKSSSIAHDRRRLRNHILPLLGRSRIDRITRGDIERLVRDVEAGKTKAPPPPPGKRGVGKPVLGGRGAARQALALLAAVMSFACDRGLVLANPCTRVKTSPPRRLERFLSEREIATLGEALDAEARATGDPYAVAAIKLLLFTGARRSEILGLRWEWIDLGRAMVHLPDSKSGKKPLYLNAPALDVLANLPRQPGNPYVVCGRLNGRAYVGLSKVWNRVRAAAGLPGVRLHDLRHSYASVGASGNNSLLILGKLLGHKHAATTERYSHLSANPMRVANEAIGRRIKSALDGARLGGEAAGDDGEANGEADVVPLPASRAAG